jgi:hypothetical protein
MKVKVKIKVMDLGTGICFREKVEVISLERDFAVYFF